LIRRRDSARRLLFGLASVFNPRTRILFDWRPDCDTVDAISINLSRTYGDWRHHTVAPIGNEPQDSNMQRIFTRSGVELFVKEWGTGRPVVLIHGWPLSADSWDDVALPLANAGFRAIAYDRRGFGRSSQPWEGYNYDTLSDDLADILSMMQLSDVTLVGFSMGGGEVARFLSRHDRSQIRSVALLSSVVPCMLRSDSNPDGVAAEVFDEMSQALIKDRPNFFTTFFNDFYGVTKESKPVSSEWLAWTHSLAMQAGLKATLDCAHAFATTDFRPDLASFTMPTLIIHGTNDKTVPIDATARKAASAIPGSELVEYPDAPHGIIATHRDQLVHDLIAFCKAR
jgi:pimeloyl-ACP methyl ester carboxylesterase